MKAFMKEHGLAVGMFGGTALLMLGKLAFGWGVTWPWVFAPIWIPLLVALFILVMVLGIIGMVFVAIFAVIAVASYLDKDSMQGFKEALKEAEAEEDEAVVERQESESVH